MTPMIPLSDDLGNSTNKLYGSYGGLALQSLVAIDGRQQISALLGLRTNKTPCRINLGDVSFYVGPNAQDYGRLIEAYDYERSLGTPETRVLFYASLTQYMENHGAFKEPVCLIIGLPLEVLSGPEAKDHAEKVRHWLKGDYNWIANGKSFQVTIAEVRVTSQPSGALFDYLLNDDGSIPPDRASHFQESMAVMSIGFGTVELLAIRQKAIVPKLTDGKMIGVRRLFKLAAPGSEISLGELDSQLRAGDLTVKPFIPIWEREIAGFIEKTWGSEWKRFKHIVLAGGGAFLLGDRLQDRFIGKVYIPDDPILSISRGLYKQAVQLTQHRS
jgi:hypothetical protein